MLKMLKVANNKFYNLSSHSLVKIIENYENNIYKWYILKINFNCLKKKF